MTSRFEVPLVPPDWPPQWSEVEEALQRAFRDGSWGRYDGPHCRQLEAALCEYHNASHAVLCSSGTAAVELALRGLKIGPGDEVILAAYDFKANMQNVLLLGATPVLIDIDEHSWQMNPALIEAACSEHTRAIIASHLHGAFVPMRQVIEIARQRGVSVIEDACQCPGAILEGRRAGTFGDVGVLSFGGSKLLTAGRGGAVITSSADIAQRIHLFHQRGNLAYPLSELQAAVLLPQLERLDARNQQRLSGARFLLKLLCENAPFLTPLMSEDVAESLNDSVTGDIPGLYKLGFQYRPDASNGPSRDDFACRVRSLGVALDPGFSGLHRTHSRRRFRTGSSLCCADTAHDQSLVLHHPVLLESAEMLTRVCEMIERASQSKE